MPAVASHKSILACFETVITMVLSIVAQPLQQHWRCQAPFSRFTVSRTEYGVIDGSYSKEA